ncbi:hypothetical protein [Brevibacillus sp. IT-7CA2]|uniref:hypothetical protein n=1 Tax=Brevibacillus sp. IT-7CA2 TaxID=3026436 RepID=UPI0039E05FC8
MDGIAFGVAPEFLMLTRASNYTNSPQATRDNKVINALISTIPFFGKREKMFAIEAPSKPE